MPSLTTLKPFSRPTGHRPQGETKGNAGGQPVATRAAAIAAR